jgi:hypothetical protein
MKNIAGMIMALASAAAISVIAPPAAKAAPKGTPSEQAQCEAGGYLWDSIKGCANKKCNVGGKYYEPGHTRVVKRRGGQDAWYMCDGFTGKWEYIP